MVRCEVAVGIDSDRFMFSAMRSGAPLSGTSDSAGLRAIVAAGDLAEGARGGGTTAVSSACESAAAGWACFSGALLSKTCFQLSSTPARLFTYC